MRGKFVKNKTCNLRQLFFVERMIHDDCVEAVQEFWAENVLATNVVDDLFLHRCRITSLLNKIPNKIASGVRRCYKYCFPRRHLLTERVREKSFLQDLQKQIYHFVRRFLELVEKKKSERLFSQFIRQNTGLAGCERAEKFLCSLGPSEFRHVESRHALY